MSAADTVKIGKYQVVGSVASGDLAEVLKARLDGIAGFSRLFAIKRILPAVADKEAWVARIEEEARRAAALAHGNLVQVLDLGRDEGRPYLVVEWVDGWSLARVLDQAREEGVQMPVAHAAWIGAAVLNALEYAHGRPDPLVHDAVCPSNVLISRGGEVKLSDFGLGRVADALAQEAPETVRRRVDRAVPEQIDGARGEPASDLFAVGTVLYEALTNAHPFRQADDDATREALLAGGWAPLAEVRDDVPAAMSEVIAAAMSTDPATRPATATAFKEVLLDVLRTGDGDVFTQETLAGWCRELFGEPEAAWGPTAAAPVSAELSDDLLEVVDDPIPDEVDLLDDLPSVADVEMPIDAERTTPAADLEPPSVDDDDDDDVKTAVGGLGGHAPAPQAPKPERWDEEGATRIDPDLAKRLAELRKAKAEAGDDDATRLRPGALDLAEVQEVANRSWLSTVAVATIMLVVGIAAGAVGVMAWGRSAGMTVLPPTLDVRTSPGVPVEVAVDGQPARAARTLTPGSHAVTVEVDGGDPWSFDLTLEAGEYRLMIVEAHRIEVPPAEEPAEEPADEDEDAP